MDVYEAICMRRTVRKFQQKKISFEILKKLVNAARLAPSGGNLQPWEFIIVDDENLLEEVFLTTAWAGYLAGKGTPKEGEKPVAYVVILNNKNLMQVTPDYDIGAAIENLILAGVNEGIGSCWIGSVNKKRLIEVLRIPESCSLKFVIALGYPAEIHIIEEMKEKNGSIKYWRDENGVHHVPKRKIEHVLHRNQY